jgi:hypothetical protein
MKDSIQQEGSERKKNDLKICICCLQLIKRIQHQNHLIQTIFGSCFPTEQVGNFIKSSQSQVSFLQQDQYLTQS